MQASSKPILPTPQLPTLAQLARRIRDCCKRMRALGANKLKLAVAIGEHLLAGRAQFTAHGTWLPWLREFCELGERQARTYVTLAQHRPEVEA